MTRYKIIWTESESLSEVLSEDEVRHILFDRMGVEDDGSPLEDMIDEYGSDFLGSMIREGFTGKGHYFESEYYDAVVLSDNTRPRAPKNVASKKSAAKKAPAKKSSSNTKAKPKATAKKPAPRRR